MDLFILTYRTLFFYFFIILSYRIMGKREVGQLGIIDLIVSILIAELVAISIENIQLRQKSISDLSQVEYAFLEPNGKLSIFKYNKLKIKSSYPMPLILDGIIQESTLKQIKHSKLWLKELLNNKKLQEKDIFYAFYKKSKVFIIKKAEII